jgi:TM2 domain-containing membrane protein YozV
MSDSQEYSLRWRGRRSGPYPVSEINRLLDDHKIGMGHEILYQDEWITLEQFFAALHNAAAPAAPRTKPAFPTMALAPEPALSPREKNAAVRLKAFTAPTAEAARGPAPAPPGEGRPRRRLVFALLAVFAGFSGAHNFYARQWMTGMLQLLLSVATSLMNFGIIASWLWAIVEAIVVRRDGRGNDMI